MSRLLCRVFGHNRPDSKTAMFSEPDGLGLCTVTWQCSCCGARVREGHGSGWIPRLTVRVRHGEIIPRGYGLAWTSYVSCEAICMPVPLNVVGRRLRDAYMAVRFYRVAVPVDPREAYAEGYRQAVKDASQ